MQQHRTMVIDMQWERRWAKQREKERIGFEADASIFAFRLFHRSAHWNGTTQQFFYRLEIYWNYFGFFSSLSLSLKPKEIAQLSKAETSFAFRGKMSYFFIVCCALTCFVTTITFQQHEHIFFSVVAKRFLFLPGVFRFSLDEKSERFVWRVFAKRLCHFAKYSSVKKLNNRSFSLSFSHARSLPRWLLYGVVVLACQWPWHFIHDDKVRLSLVV